MQKIISIIQDTTILQHRYYYENISCTIKFKFALIKIVASLSQFFLVIVKRERKDKKEKIRKLTSLFAIHVPFYASKRSRYFKNCNIYK